MIIPLNIDERKKTRKQKSIGERKSIGDFNWDGNLKSFACRRFDTAYAAPPGKKRRPNGYRENLTADLNAVGQRYGIPLPSGTSFVQNLDQQLIKREADSETDSEIMKKYNKAGSIERVNVRRADPENRARDQETKSLYSSSKRAKEIRRIFVTNKGMKEKGIPQPKLPHIESLELKLATVRKFIRNQKKRDCDSLTLQQLIERPLNHIFLDINGSSKINRTRFETLLLTWYSNNVGFV